MAGRAQYSASVESRTMANPRVRSLSLPSDLVREAERLAKQEGRTKTEILREALRRYSEERRWRGLQRYGAGRAKKVGMSETDVERAIQEFRRGQ
jgi:CopG family transcriptional regulator/antitoxin EndoAI